MKRLKRVPNQVMIIAGPTASGKSSLALKMAGSLDGEIINGDSMQLYRDLPLLTAAPTPVDYQHCPHHLYQVLEADQVCSVGQWRSMALHQCQAIIRRGKLPILVGGTGLYLRALEKGLAFIPAIDVKIRHTLKERLQKEGLPTLYRELCQLDAIEGARLSCQDTQRILRALEVLYGTGKPLRWWHQRADTQPPAFVFKKILLSYPRDVLMDYAAKRWEDMKEKGVIQKVEEWLEKSYPSASSLYKAIGLYEIQEFLRGHSSLTTLDAAVLTATRRYIKRQQTWFQHQFTADICLKSSDEQKFLL